VSSISTSTSFTVASLSYVAEVVSEFVAKVMRSVGQHLDSGSTNEAVVLAVTSSKTQTTITCDEKDTTARRMHFRVQGRGAEIV